MPRRPKESKANPLPKPKKITPPNLLRGMKDILPDEHKYWKFVQGSAEKMASAYGFGKIITPVLEETSLFARTIGSSTDIVEKEMFSFVDQGKSKVTLRPEATAPIARAYMEHGMASFAQPIKLYYMGPMFRHERPQAGRFRQHYQFGLETLGSDDPVVDAQIILFSHSFFQELKIRTNIQINSLGCPECREEYKKLLAQYYKSKRNILCPDCKRRLGKNPLRLLDCKENSCQSIIGEAPQIVDSLDEGCKSHFIRVLEYLDEIEIPYVLNPHLVRGLDYYNRTVFEVWPAPAGKKSKDERQEAEKHGQKEQEAEKKEASSQSALGGGGRYDGLIGMLGGQDTPACGAAFGIERIIAKIKEENISVPEGKGPDVFLAQLGESARRKTLKLFEELRKSGIKAAESFSKGSLRAQLEIANKLGAKFVLILGQKEILDGTILVRDMKSGIQEIENFSKIIAGIKKRLKK